MVVVKYLLLQLGFFYSRPNGPIVFILVLKHKIYEQAWKKCATAGRSKVGPRSKVRTLSGQILPHFDINNFSVAQKLTKLDSLVLVQIKLALIIALISHKVC